MSYCVPFYTSREVIHTSSKIRGLGHLPFSVTLPGSVLDNYLFKVIV